MELSSSGEEVPTRVLSVTLALGELSPTAQSGHAGGIPLRPGP